MPAPIAPYLSTVDRAIADGPFAASWPSLMGQAVPRWYLDGKFGIFIHWGVYAVPAFGNEWYAHSMYKPGSPEFAHFASTVGPHDRCGYKDLIPGLTGARFDAAAWVDLFRRAGARFVVPVAEHHDGFAMYDCSFSDWTAVRMGPKRDVVGELAAATRAAGLVFGLSSHRAEHAWFFGHGLSHPCDVQDPRYAGLYGPVQAPPADHATRQFVPQDPAFLDDWLARTCELVDRYQPQLVWFDWWIQNACFKPYLQRFAAYYYNRAAAREQGVAINYKFDAFVEGTAVFDLERGQLRGASPRFWQNDTAVAKNSWGFTEGQDYKRPTDLIHDLVDIVSKNGALLLNVGPRADGSIPEPDQAILLAIGAWLERNGAAIYRTRPWSVFGEGPTRVPEGSFSDTKRAPFTSQDIRFTTAGGALYATVLGWPADGRVLIRSLGSDLALRSEPIAAVELLGHGPVSWERRAEGLEVRFPERPVGEHAWVLRITG